MKPIAPLVYQWSQYDAEHGLDHNGYFVQAAADEPGALIDPVALHPIDGKRIARLRGAAAVLYTSASLARERAAAACAERFRCPVRVPAGDQDGAAGAEQFRPEELLPAALTAVPVPGGAAPDEIAFRDAGGSVFVGGAVFGAPAGQVSQVAHAIANTGDEPLRYLAFGTPAETLEMIDFPTSGKRAEATAFGTDRRCYSAGAAPRAVLGT